ncbi:hypothetical protein ACFXG4_43485 [Nocardia sp. NPDC059246]|uniref:hypothetical protein n=1 Tax=unclassified Nocardia TaxID=2637762 RepID=UPI003698274A
MPKSETRKPKSKDRPRTAPSGVAWDKLMSELAAAHLLTGSPGERALGLAMSAWVGAGDPNRAEVEMRQCWHACYMIAMLLREAGIAANPLPVEVQVLRDGQCVERIGSLEPRHENGGKTWNGHVVLQIPELGVVFDPTIGQGRFAVTDRLRSPVLIRNPQLVRRAPAGSQFQVLRPPQLSLVYTVTHSGERVDQNPLYPLQKQEIDAAVQRCRPFFLEGVNRLEGLTQA